MEDGRRLVALLVFRVRDRTCALPVSRVRETLRPLPITPIPGSPSHVAGMSLIRGQAVPVLDAGMLLGTGPALAQRFISLATHEASQEADLRPCALAVEQVEGIRLMPEAELQALPTLLQGAEAATVSLIAPQNKALLMVLDGMRLLSLAEQAPALPASAQERSPA